MLARDLLLLFCPSAVNQHHLRNFTLYVATSPLFFTPPFLLLTHTAEMKSAAKFPTGRAALVQFQPSTQRWLLSPPVPPPLLLQHCF